MQLFTFLMHGEVINEQRNFETFGNSFLLLVQARPQSPASHAAPASPGESERRGCAPRTAHALMRKRSQRLLIQSAS